LVLGVFLCGSLVTGNALAQERIGTVKNVNIYAYGTPVGQKSRVPAFARDVAKTQTEYETIKGASMTIALDGGGALVLSGKSAMTLERSGAGPVVRIRTGTVQTSGKANIRIVAGSSTALFRNGRLSVETDRTGASLFSLFQGEADLGIGGNKPLTIEAGTAVAVSSNGQIALGRAGTKPRRGTTVSRAGRDGAKVDVPSQEGFSFESGGFSFSGVTTDGSSAGGTWSGGGSSGGFTVGGNGTVTVTDGQSGGSVSVGGDGGAGGAEDPGM
jgi:hypothetical protein